MSLHLQVDSNEAILLKFNLIILREVFIMSVSVLGIDIAKQKFDAALLLDGKLNINPVRIRWKVLRPYNLA